MPITIGIVIVLAIVVTSYQQTVAAYPHGGGSYIVAKDNLGTRPGLVAAAALLTDYVLTVAVSIAAGVAALTSIIPELFEYRVALGVVLVVLIAIVNLRGIRESGAFFSIPTYVYLVSIFGLLGASGLFRYATGTMPDYQAPAGWLTAEAAEPLGILLILRAFSSGSVALTGTEAVSNGVPAFKPPEPRNAQIVLILMGTVLRPDLPRDELPCRPARHRPRPDRAGDGRQPADERLRRAPARRTSISSRSRRRSSSCSPPTPRSPTSRASRASWPATVSCLASSSSGATGSRSATGSSCWRRSRCCWSSPSAAASRP